MIEKDTSENLKQFLHIYHLEIFKLVGIFNFCLVVVPLICFIIIAAYVVQSP